MHQTYDCLIDSYLENKVGIAKHFLNTELTANLKANLMRLFASEQLQKAGIGNNSKLIKNEQIRTDKIYWLDRKHEDIFENDFFDLIDDFVLYLNRTCYTGITDYEFHYALYEKGSFYKRHLDQFKDNNRRAFSMIFYLNIDWKIGNGGELCIYNLDKTQTVSPENGKCVFFKSDELEHEVLISQTTRMSVTGWLKTR